LRNVESHLAKVAEDYVRPDKGSAEFAFVYIPSESVYYFLVHEGYDLLRTYARRGVQTVSPLTLSHKLELIKAGLHAQRLSENALKVRQDLWDLGRRFALVDEAWRVLYRTHVHNLAAKAEDVDRAYDGLRDLFQRICITTGTEPEGDGR
jgi:DNA recombination protein RmuC